MSEELEDQILEDLYSWLDQIPLSREKKSVRRDFADGVLAAEIVKFYFPELVDIHNYTPASMMQRKIDNWNLLNKKVFRKLGFELQQDVISKLVAGRQGEQAAEHFLIMLRSKVERKLFQKKRQNENEIIDRKSKIDRDHQIPPLTYPAVQKLRGTLEAGSVMANERKINYKFSTPRTKVINQNQQDVVSKLALEEVEQELLTRDETIQVLQAKVRRLEHLLHLKDIRIEDLQARLQMANQENINRAQQLFSQHKVTTKHR